MASNALASISARYLAEASMSLPPADPESAPQSVDVIAGDCIRFRITFAPQVQPYQDGSVQGYWTAECATRVQLGKLNVERSPR